MIPIQNPIQSVDFQLKSGCEHSNAVSWNTSKVAIPCKKEGWHSSKRFGLQIVSLKALIRTYA
jgi:hypothetical protein